MVNIITGTPFAAVPRLHHRENESTLVFPSSATSRARGLNALKAQNWKAAKKSGPTARDYVQNGLVAMWDGIENAGWGVHVDSGNSWTDLVGGVAYSGSVGWNSDSAVFNGTSDYLASDAFIPEESIVTCEFVIRPESVSGAAFVACQDIGGYSGRQRQAIFLQNGRVNFGSRIAGGRAVSAEYSRHSYSAVYTDARYYVDSTLVDTVAAVDYWGCTKASIGCNFNKVKRNLFKGEIHSIRIYSRALTASEIEANYAVDKARFGLT